MQTTQAALPKTYAWSRPVTTGIKEAMTRDLKARKSGIHTFNLRINRLSETYALDGKKILSQENFGLNR